MTALVIEEFANSKNKTRSKRRSPITLIEVPQTITIPTLSHVTHVTHDMQYDIEMP